MNTTRKTGGDHLSVCRFAHGHKGVFHNTSFDINYWRNLLLELLSRQQSFVGITFRTFTQHFFAEKCTFPLPDNNLRIPFPLFTIAFAF
jgi:hypothetical protein